MIPTGPPLPCKQAVYPSRCEIVSSRLSSDVPPSVQLTFNFSCHNFLICMIQLRLIIREPEPNVHNTVKLHSAPTLRSYIQCDLDPPGHTIPHEVAEVYRRRVLEALNPQERRGRRRVARDADDIVSETMTTGAHVPDLRRSDGALEIEIYVVGAGVPCVLRRVRVPWRTITNNDVLLSSLCCCCVL